MNDNTALILMIALVATVVFILWIVHFVTWLNDFQQELLYINNEIARTTGRERKIWKKRRRRLWLTVIPFVRY